MQKTRVILAFGNHGGAVEGKRYEPNREFFRGAIVPVIEEIANSGKKAVVIDEQCPVNSFAQFGLNLFQMRKGMASRTVIEGVLRYATAMANNAYSETRDRGIWPDGEIEFGGYEPEMLRVNFKNPGQIRTVIEPQDVDAVISGMLMMKHMDTLFDFGSKILIINLMLLMKEIAKHMFIRDKLVVGLAEQLAAEDPERMILIPRGTKHRVMAGLFDSSRFELDVKAERAPDIDDLMIALCYGKEPDYMKLRAMAEEEAKLRVMWRAAQ